MPEETTETSAAEAPKPVKKSRMKLFVALALVVLLIAGGGGFYFWRMRAAPTAKAASSKHAVAESPSEKTENSDDEEKVTQAIELQPFIVNLADKNESRYLRMTISLGVGEAGEAKADPLYTTKIRNAILATISTRTSEQILTVEGKAALRKDMLTAARSAASKPEVLTIYITDFIIQM